MNKLINLKNDLCNQNFQIYSKLHLLFIPFSIIEKKIMHEIRITLITCNIRANYRFIKTHFTIGRLVFYSGNFVLQIEKNNND